MFESYDCFCKFEWYVKDVVDLRLGLIFLLLGRKQTLLNREILLWKRAVLL